MNAICIERCTPSRLDEVLDITRDTILTSYAEHYPREAVQYFLNYHSPESVLDDIEGGYTAVLNNSGRTVGTGTLRETNVKRVFVLPGFQGRGFGKMLMRHLEDYAGLQGLRFLDLHSSLPAKRFYDSLRYRTLVYSQIPLGNNTTLDYYRMAKPVGKDCTRPGWNLHGKILSPSPGPGGGTRARGSGLFVFFQQDEMVLGQPAGAIEDGELIGLIEGDVLSFRFEDLSICGMLGAGCGTGRIERIDGDRVRLTGEWWSESGKGLFAFEEGE